MKLNDFNKLSKKKAKEQLMNCCGSAKWTSLMMKHFPFDSHKSMVDNATTIWFEECKVEDWEEALKHHPKIGDILMLTKKLVVAASQAGEELAGVNESTEEMLKLLKFANEEYEKQNGFIFILSASGKSSSELLRQMIGRLYNSREEEMDIAMGEQHKITLIRMMRFIEGEEWNLIPEGQVTAEATNTDTGLAAKGITVRLKDCWKGSWQTIAQGETNAEGKLVDLLPAGRLLEEGNYQLVFETGDYFKDNQLDGFYPQVEIQFTISDKKHYHIPLFISPQGYSTKKEAVSQDQTV